MRWSVLPRLALSAATVPVTRDEEALAVALLPLFSVWASAL
jgi:hypothetical protein